MMHRDLKSPNVLLSEEGVAKIAVRLAPLALHLAVGLGAASMCPAPQADPAQ